MKRSEASGLLSLAAAFDQRTIGDADVNAWALVLADVDYGRAQAAVVAHYRESSARIMPADVVRLCRSAGRPDLARFVADVQRPDQAAINARGRAAAVRALADCRGPMVEDLRRQLVADDA